MLTIDYDLIGIKDGEQVLDVGCGEGRHSWEACKRNDCLVCALDLDETNLKKAHYALYLMEQQGETRGKWLRARGTITSLPFKDASFDKVICSEVLEHIPNDIQGIRELVRVLKGDGTLAISVPSYLPETSSWSGIYTTTANLCDCSIASSINSSPKAWSFTPAKPTHNKITAIPLLHPASEHDNIADRRKVASYFIQ